MADERPQFDKTNGYGEMQPVSEADVEGFEEEADQLETQEGVDTSGPH